MKDSVVQSVNFVVARNHRTSRIGIGSGKGGLRAGRQFCSGNPAIGIGVKLKQAESDNMALKSDLGFFERLLPAGAGEGLIVRGLQAELPSPGQVRYQLLLMQAGKVQSEFSGRYEITLSGTLDGKPWAFGQPGGPQPVQLKQYLRVGGMFDHPAQAVVKTVSVRVMDLKGAVKASLTVKP